MIKKISLIFACSIIFFCSIVFASEPIKVTVMPWSIKWYIKTAVEYGILQKEDNFFEQIMASIENNIKSKKGFELSSKKFGSDENAAGEFFFGKDENMLSFPFPFPKPKEKYDADLVILLQNASDEFSDKFIEILIVAAETGRTAVSLIEDAMVNNENLSSIINKKISQGLKYAEDILKINADKLFDSERSIVQYKLLTLSNENILMNVDYDSGYEKVQNVAFILENNKDDGEYRYKLLTKQKEKLNITYFFKNNKIINVKVATDFRPKKLSKNSSNVFTVMSEKGYKIDFEFFWDGNRIANVKVFPRLNPCYPIEVTF